ncbi:hypothetical protein B0H11DRAFT_1900563 [Mycena galericulata]|nr:hypothetical protein B0H11DRAFT_1900563 [Mycena galericulata]
MLWLNPDFWLLFGILSMLSGTGLISMSAPCLAKGNAAYGAVEALRWQATQVSTISIMNFSGRILVAWGSRSRPRSFSIAFGQNLNVHEPGESTTATAAVAALAMAHQCLEGRSCYVATPRLTGTTCFAAILLRRSRRKLMAAPRLGRH